MKRSSKQTGRVCVLFVALGLVGCRNGSAASEGGTSQAGTYSDNAADAPAKSEASSDTVGQPGTGRAQLVAEVRIDGNRNNLSPVGEAAVTERGHIVVAQHQDYQFVVFDSSGRRVAAMGKQGSGPGEFRNALMWRWGLVGDTIWVYDPAPQRLTWLTLAGRVVRTRPVPEVLLGQSGNRSERRARDFTPAGLLGDGRGMVGFATVSRGDVVDTSATRVLLKTTLSGDAPSVVAQLPRSATMVSLVLSEGRSVGTSIPFASSAITAVSPDARRFLILETEFASVRSGRLLLTLLSESGDTIYRRGEPFVPRPVSDEEYRARLNERRETLARSHPRTIVDAILAELERRRPLGHSAVSRAAVGVDGSVLYQLRDGTTGGGVHAVVLDPRGNRVAAFPLPEGSRVIAFSASRVWVITRDADGVNSVVRYRIIPPRDSGVVR